MINYLPKIYPDELVYSWFCRFYVHSGCITNKAALKELFFSQSSNPSKEFIGHLNPKARDKIESMYPMESLILHHTMFPQYARFIPMTQKVEALYRLTNDFCDAHHLFSILPRGAHEEYLRFCPVCAAEDRKEYGEAYWHRKHQIRNIVICPKHGCMLEDSSVSVKSERSFALCPAEVYIDDRKAAIIHNPNMLRYSEYMDVVFDAPLDFTHDTPLNAIIYSGLHGTKYLASTGKMRFTKRLADDVQRFYAYMGVNGTTSFHQVQRLLLGERYDFSIACQIAYFLGLSPEAMTCSAPNATAETKRSKYTVDWKKNDSDKAPAMEAFCKAIYNGTASKTGRPERVSERLVYDGLHLAKHQLENMPICRAIFEKYTESYEENWARRIIWAYQKLSAERNGMPIHWSDIRFTAGVKREKLPKVIPWLLEYPDREICEAILALVYA